MAQAADAESEPVTPRARGQGVEQAILDATLQVLAEGGYEALTIDRVAARARSSKTTIYRRWKTKEHLALALLAGMPAFEPPLDGSLEQNLIALFGQFLRAMRDSPLAGVLPKLTAECVNNPALSAMFAQVNNRRRAPIRAVLRRAIERGELAADADIELTIDVIQGAISIRVYFLLDPLTDDWIAGLVRLLIHGIGGRR